MLEPFQRGATREQQLAYAILRSFLGVCFWAHALVIVFYSSGLPAMANHMVFAMSETHLPPNLVLAFAYLIPAFDFVIGSMLVLGVGTLSAIFVAYAYLCVLILNFSLDTDYLALVVALAVGVALAFLMIGHRRFDLPWYRLLIPRKPRS